MFTSKVKMQVQHSSNAQPETSAFVEQGMKMSSETLSENGALKYSSTGNAFVDQFGSLSRYKSPRSFTDVSKDMSTIWAINPRLTVMFVLFIRMITRITSIINVGKTKSVQRGAGLRSEGIMRMMWLHIFQMETFVKNIRLFISVGSWKDIIQMLSLDLQYHGWHHRRMDWDFMANVIKAGIENPDTTNLVRKYLPQIRSNKQCTTLEAQCDNQIAKWICSLIYGNKMEEKGVTYKKYRKLKANGTAHQWQQLISQGKHDLVDFNTVHGRALALMVSGKYLKNNGLEEKYQQWISTQPVAKFTGFPHELFAKKRQYKYQKDTVDKQFLGLIDTAKENLSESRLIVVRDTSASMQAIADGTNMRAYDIAKALGLFFSYLLKGPFENAWIEFQSTAKMHKWEGSTPTEKWENDDSDTIGNTNFQSVIDLFVRLRQNGIPEEEFPTGILCISDGEFDPGEMGETNVDSARRKLRQVFSEEYASNFKIVLWNIPSNFYRRKQSLKFETFGDVENVFYFCGYDPSIVAFLTGFKHTISEPKTAMDLFLSAMEQEVMQFVQV